MDNLTLGSIAQQEFILQATKRGLTCSLPVVDKDGYDLIVDGKKLYKIQIKSTATVYRKNENGERYRITASKGCNNKRSYERGEVDFFAFYIHNLGVWFIIPFKDVNCKNINLYPSSSSHKYSSYIEAWHLLK